MSENSKYNFVEKLAGSIGFPYWDKSITTSGKALARQNFGEEGTVFIPFVPNGDSLVKTTLAITIGPGDTSFRFISNWQYHDRVNGSMTVDSTAENMAALFMLLQKEVSGHKRFHITDPSLFANLPVPPGVTGREIVIHEADARTARLSTSTILYCFYGYVCGTPSNVACTGPSGCDYENCPTNQCYATSTCIEFEVEEGTGGGGPIGGGGTGGGPTGGGSGGSGGGWNPPDIPCVPTQANNNCGQGWVIVPDPDPPTTEPVDSILSKYSRKFRRFGDSVYTNLSQPANREYFFAGARNNTTNDTAILNIWTDNDSTSVTPNLSTPGHFLLFMWHSHVSTSQNIVDRGSFSSADINYLRKPQCLKQNFTSFADCGNKQYALVITDVAKAQAFFAANDYYNSILNNYTTTGGGNYQQIQERCVKNVIGSAAANGISFYVSTDAPGFSTWTLLNP